MSIYDFTPAELEEIRRADAEMERGGKPVFRDTRGRKPGELPPNNRAANPVRDWRYRAKLGARQVPHPGMGKKFYK